MSTSLKEYSNNYTQYFNEIKIDSLRLLIPIEKVNIISDSINQNVISINGDSGIVLKEHIQTSKHFIKNGVGIGFAIISLINGRSKQQSQYLAIGFSAKLLEYKYLEGINKDNIRQVYKYIISTKEVEISFNDFLYSKVVDVDFCIDYMLQNTAKEVCKISHSLTKDEYKIGFCGLFTKSTNIGIQWGDRRKVGKAYKKKQFLKYYSKGLEFFFKDSTKPFYEKYIKPKIDILQDIENWLRVETTIKNKAHFNTYGYGIDTLFDLLSVKVDERIFQRPINTYMSSLNTISIKANRDDLSNSDLLTLNYMQDIIRFKNYTINEAINYMLQGIEMGKKEMTKQQRYKAKKRLENISKYIEVKSNRNKTNLDGDLTYLTNYILFPND